MSNEPSRSELDRFLVTEYAALAKRKLETNATGVVALLKASQAAHASTLFYMRTGMLYREWPLDFKAFQQLLEEQAADINRS